MLRNRDIVMIASARWKMAGKVNCHHIAERLAEHNRVLFVESPGLRSPKPNSLRTGGDFQKMISRGGDWLRSITGGPLRVADTLHVLSPLAYPMHGHRIAEPVNRHLFGGAVRSTAKRLAFTDPLLWIFPPTGASVLDAFPDAPVIYHCVDHYAGIHGANAATLTAMQRRLLKRAQLVFATSRPLARSLAPHHPRVVCMTNVSEVEHFTSPCRLPSDLANLPRPVIGYLGHISSSMIDTALLGRIATQRPNWSIVLIGTIGDDETQRAMEKLRRLGNVYPLGQRPYHDAPAYVQGFDACLIPFARNSLTECALPLKTFEYLAAGKPVVSTPLSAMREEPLDDVVRYGDDGDTFVSAIEAALACDCDHARAKRVAIAHDNSWDKRYPEIAREAARLFVNDNRTTPAIR